MHQGHEDLDLDRASRAGQPVEGQRGDVLAEAIASLRRVLQSEIDRHRDRADEAVARVAELEDEVVVLQVELEHTRSGARQAQQRLLKGVSDYLDDTARAQQALITIARHALGTNSRADVENALSALRTAEDETQPEITDQPVEQLPPPQPHLQVATLHWRTEPPAPVHPLPAKDVEASEPSPLRSQFHPGDVESSSFFENETTDEHRLIDLSNEADMFRLDARSRLGIKPPVLRLRSARPAY